jgi:hypothetical protein
MPSHADLGSVQREELKPPKFYGSWMKLSLDTKKREV